MQRNPLTNNLKVEVSDPVTGIGASVVAANSAIAATDPVMRVQIIDSTGAVGSGVSGVAEDSAHVSGDLGSMAMAVRNDAGTSLAGTDLDYIPLTTDSLGNQFETLGTLIEGEDPMNRVMATADKGVIGTTYALSTDISAALEASTISKATAGIFYSADGRIDSTCPTGTYYILIMNSATLPADGAVTRIWGSKKLVHTTGTDTNFSIDLFGSYVYASAGIVMCLSTTEFTKTIAGAYLSAVVKYV